MTTAKYYRAVLLAALLCPAVTAAQVDSARRPPPVISVLVSGLSPETGTVEVSLFDSAESFFKEPFRQETGEVSEGGQFGAKFLFVPEGDYAIVVAHDANDNGKLDTGFLGFGGERYGYSNNVRTWFGRPNFDDVKFRVEEDGARVEIDLD